MIAALTVKSKLQSGTRRLSQTLRSDRRHLRSCCGHCGNASLPDAPDMKCEAPLMSGLRSSLVLGRLRPGHDLLAGLVDVDTGLQIKQRARSANHCSTHPTASFKQQSRIVPRTWTKQFVYISTSLRVDASYRVHSLGIQACASDSCRPVQPLRVWPNCLGQLRIAAGHHLLQLLAHCRRGHGALSCTQAGNRSEPYLAGKQYSTNLQPKTFRKKLHSRSLETRSKLRTRSPSDAVAPVFDTVKARIGLASASCRPPESESIA